MNLDLSKLVKYSGRVPSLKPIIFMMIGGAMASGAGLVTVLMNTYKLFFAVDVASAPVSFSWLVGWILLFVGVTMYYMSSSKYKKYLSVSKGIVVCKEIRASKGFFYGGFAEWSVLLYGYRKDSSLSFEWHKVGAGEYHDIQEGDLMEFGC
jgi:hypothetical protein